MGRPVAPWRRRLPGWWPPTRALSGRRSTGSTRSAWPPWTLGGEAVPPDQR